MAAFYQFTKPGNEEALVLLARAIELDPDFAAAYGMSARCYMQRKGFGWVGDRDREVAETARMARRAVDLGRDDAVALCTAGFALAIVVGALDEGVALIDNGLALNPNLGWAWHFIALARAFLGQPEIAIEHAARAIRYSPQDPQIFAMQTAAAFGRLWLAVTQRLCHQRKSRFASSRISSSDNASPQLAARLRATSLKRRKRWRKYAG